MDEVWYEVVDPAVPLTQGDLIFECPILSWESENLKSDIIDELEVLDGATSAISSDVIVMTQACDLEYNKVENAILCPHNSIEEYYEFWKTEMENRGQNPRTKAWNAHCDTICDGFVWNLSMLSGIKTGNLDLEVRIVDFHEIYSVPRKFLESLIVQRGAPRFRLLPPYREHLSQAFARYFMRVGLPIPISKDWQT